MPFLVLQHAVVCHSQKKVIIKKVRLDLRPGIPVYETQDMKGREAGFYQDYELTPVLEVITHKQWDSYARRIEHKNLKERGRSRTFSGIAYRANAFIVETDKDTKVVRKGWRDAMKQEDPEPDPKPGGDNQ